VTTIVYKDGIVAYDSRVTRGNLIEDDDCEKCVELRGVYFILAGDESLFERAMELYFGEGIEVYRGNVSGLAIDCGILWHVGISGEEGFWKVRLDPNKPTTFGSGYQHAVTAIDMGASATEAVRMAALRDNNTGGRVRKLEGKILWRPVEVAAE
jgi:hypothetical protein